MNRKMTDLALAGKCGGLAASGFTRSAAPRRRVQQRRQRERAEAVRRAHQHVAARYRGANVTGRSGDIDELISIQQSQTEIRQRAAGLEELRAPAASPAGAAARDSASCHAVSIWQRAVARRRLFRSRAAKACDSSCMKSLLNSESACSACVLTGRTGHDVMVSG